MSMYLNTDRYTQQCSTVFEEYISQIFSNKYLPPTNLAGRWTYVRNDGSRGFTNPDPRPNPSGGNVTYFSTCNKRSGAPFGKTTRREIRLMSDAQRATFLNALVRVLRANQNQAYFDQCRDHRPGNSSGSAHSYF